MSRNFMFAFGLLLLALAWGLRGLAQGGADRWFGVVALLAVPFFAFSMWRARRR